MVNIFLLLLTRRTELATTLGLYPPIEKKAMKGKLSNPNLILEEVPEAERLQNSLNGNTTLIEEEDNQEDEVEEDDIPFTKKMRIATRKVHNVSDALVNAKVGLAMSDDKIWAEGLLIFYEIFRFLEDSMVRLCTKNEHFSRMYKVIIGIERTPAFETDLEFYYGKDYLKSYDIRPSVADYLKHLQTLEQREPLRLLAYIYHLYMGLLSGGQILKKKRDLGNRIKVKAFHVLGWFGFGRNRSTETEATEANEVITPPSTNVKPGNAVTTFGQDGRSISEIKKEIAFTMNDIAADLSTDEKNSLISESLEVFQRNNEIVGSIHKTGLTALKNYAMVFVMILVSVGTACYFLFVQGDWF